MIWLFVHGGQRAQFSSSDCLMMSSWTVWAKQRGAASEINSHRVVRAGAQPELGMQAAANRSRFPRTHKESRRGLIYQEAEPSGTGWPGFKSPGKRDLHWARLAEDCNCEKSGL